MAVFFQIVGVLFCLLLLLIAGGVLFVRYKIRQALASLQSAAPVGTPPRIHLERLVTPEWNDAAATAAQLDPLRALGFEDAGLFCVREMPDIRFQALAQPSESLYAVVYEHPAAGVWLDLVCRFQDGTSLTYLNTRQGSGMEQRPGHGKMRAPGLDPVALYQRILAERPQRPLLPARPEDFATTFEHAYAEEMDWRNSRGGPTTAEVRAVLAESGTEATEEQIAATQEILTYQALEGLEAALRERFLEQSTLTAAEWEEVRERVVFVHDRLPAGAVLELFDEWVDADLDAAEEEEMAPTGTIREQFARLNATLPNSDGFHKLGEVSTPVPADVYVAPQEESV